LAAAPRVNSCGVPGLYGAITIGVRTGTEEVDDVGVIDREFSIEFATIAARGRQAPCNCPRWSIGQSHIIAKVPGCSLVVVIRCIQTITIGTGYTARFPGIDRKGATVLAKAKLNKGALEV